MELIDKAARNGRAGTPSAKPGRPRRFGRRTWVSVHRILGLVLLVPFTLLAVTGSILVFEQELFELAHPSFVTPTADGSVVSYDALIATVAAARPHDHPGVLYVQSGPSLPITFWTEAGDFVAVAAGSARIVDEVAYSRGFMALVNRIHLYLALPAGENLVGATALATLVMGATGLYLWWPRGRNRALAFRLVWKGPKVAKSYALHKTIGFYVMAPLILMSATGALVAFPALENLLFHRLAGDTGTPTPSMPQAAQPARLVGADRAMDIARSAMPDAWIVRVAVSDGQSPWRVQMRRHGDPYTNGSINVYVHPATGAVIGVSDPMMERPNRAAAAWIIPLHFGSWAGAWGSAALETVVRIAWLAAVASAALLAIAGGLLWAWRR